MTTKTPTILIKKKKSDDDDVFSIVRRRLVARLFFRTVEGDFFLPLLCLLLLLLKMHEGEDKIKNKIIIINTIIGTIERRKTRWFLQKRRRGRTSSSHSRVGNFERFSVSQLANPHHVSNVFRYPPTTTTTTT